MRAEAISFNPDFRALSSGVLPCKSSRWAEVNYQNIHCAITWISSEVVKFPRAWTETDPNHRKFFCVSVVKMVKISNTYKLEKHCHCEHEASSHSPLNANIHVLGIERTKLKHYRK